MARFRKPARGDTAPKFQVGDVVMIRSDLKLYKSYPDDLGARINFVQGMEHLCGRAVTIVCVVNKDRGIYRVGSNIYNWTSSMFEGYEDQSTQIPIDETLLLEVLDGAD